MGVDRSLESLQPAMKAACECFEAECARQNFPVYRVETNRAQNVQVAYWAQGRDVLAKVNELRRIAGLAPITAEENKKIITQTLKSNHTGGNAADYCPMKDGKLYWSAPDEVWKKMGEIAEACGLDWCAGGKGQHWGWDSPHMELMKG